MEDILYCEAGIEVDLVAGLVLLVIDDMRACDTGAAIIVACRPERDKIDTDDSNAATRTGARSQHHRNS